MRVGEWVRWFRGEAKGGENVNKKMDNRQPERGLGHGGHWNTDNSKLRLGSGLGKAQNTERSLEVLEP